METVQETLNPTGPGQQDEFTEHMRGPNFNFVGAKRLPDGSYAGVYLLMFTYAICLGVAPGRTFKKRFCYDDVPSCLHEYRKLSASSDEPEGWIARRFG